MAGINGIHTSEALNKDIFKESPTSLKLQKQIDDMLAQFSPEAKSPKVKEALSRIDSIAETLASLAGDTRREIVQLYTETVVDKQMSAYEDSIAALQSRQSDHINNLLLGNSTAVLHAHQSDRIVRPANDTDVSHAA